MAFPTSVSGEFEVRPLSVADANQILDDLQRALARAKAGGITQVGNTLSFRGRLFSLLPTWQRTGLEYVDRGSVEVLPGDPGVIRYDLSTLWFTAMMALGLPVGLWWTGLWRDLGSAMPLVLLWLFAFGANHLSGRAALRRFLADAVNLDAQGPGSRACPACGTRYDPSDYRSDAPEKRCSTCNQLLEALSVQHAHQQTAAPGR